MIVARLLLGFVVALLVLALGVGYAIGQQTTRDNLTAITEALHQRGATTAVTNCTPVPKKPTAKKTKATT